MEFENKILKTCGWNEILSKCLKLDADVLVSAHTSPCVFNGPLKEAIPGPLKEGLDTLIENKF